MEEQKDIESGSSPKKRPKWLRALESQSWQAELIISGLAIFGSLQLPALLNNLINYCLFNFSEEYMEIFSFFFIYPYAAAATLIFSFIAHLGLRALWIGMLGLVSVYPNEINLDQDHFSRDYMQKYLKEYPDVNQFNKKLDDLCSSIFAGSAAIAIVMIMISITISLILIIATIINFIIPSVSILDVFIVLLIIFFLISIFASLLNSKKLRDKKWVQKIHFPFTQLFGKIVYLFAMRPISYITMIFVTNSKKSSSSPLYAISFVVIFSFVFGFFLVVPFLRQSNIGYFQQKNFFSYRTNSYHLKSAQYENLFPEEPTLLAPFIQSDIIDGKMLKLFIPWLYREQAFANEICGEYIEKEDMSRNEKRAAMAKHAVDCSKKYFEISLNDSILIDLKYYQHHHSNNGEVGFLTYISTKDCLPMENIIKIKSHYKNDEGEMRETEIPFIFEGE
ncbi:MAG: hypothetical protein ACJAT4_002351 [Granulosicoccus sp.]|jgi:hypothetical protein